MRADQARPHLDPDNTTNLQVHRQPLVRSRHLRKIPNSTATGVRRSEEQQERLNEYSREPNKKGRPTSIEIVLWTD